MNATVERVRVRALTLPTQDRVESDGTLQWRATTMVLVECRSREAQGIGYSYVHASAARLVESLLAPCVQGVDALATAQSHARMVRAMRNQGRAGIGAEAISAVDIALWDLKARLLQVPLCALIGGVRTEVPVYASGGFTSSDPDELARELASYVSDGFRRVKIKIGRDPSADRERVKLARAAIGPGVELMVDANGAYERKQALALAEAFAEHDVVWFEEPVSSDDLAGLRLLRDRAPAAIRIAAGEYGYDASYFRRMLSAEAVDVLQADATRCAGVTGFLRADALCSAFSVPLSTHCAPTLHAQLAAASSNLYHLEYFRDHARMEGCLFEGTPSLARGSLHCAGDRPGLGITLREQEVERHVA